MSIIRRALEQRHLTSFGGHSSDYGMTVPSNSEGYANTTGVAVNDTSALQLTAFYACVRLIADSIASLPWDSYRKRGAIRQEVDPQPSLLREPFFDMSEFDWKHQVMVSLLMRGNFYGDIVGRDTLGYPTQIMPLHPDAVVLERDPDTYELSYRVNGNRRPRTAIFHVRAFTLPGQDTGLSPVQMARQSLGLGMAAEQFGAKWFRDGAAPSSVLESDTALNLQQTRDLQQQWISSHGGRRRPAVLSGGVHWKPITITPEESQFLQTRDMQVSEIARYFGVPPHMIGQVDKSTSWGTGIEQQSIGFVTYTLRPWLIRLEAALTRQVPRGQFVKFNVNGLLRGDTKSRFEAHQMALNAGWMNPDEVRSLEDRPPIPGGAGKKYRQPLNMGPLGIEPEPKPDPEDEPEEPTDNDADNA